MTKFASATTATCSFCKSNISSVSFVHTDEVSPKLIVDGLAVKPMFKGIAALVVQKLIWAPAQTEICETCFVEFAAAMEPATGFSNALAASDGVNFFPVFVKKPVAVVKPKPDNDPKPEPVAAVVAPQPKAEAPKSVVVAVAKKPEPEAKKPEAPATTVPTEKSVFRSIAQVANAILANKANVQFSQKMESMEGVLLTQCIVHRNAQLSCICGGWHDWSTMPALTRRSNDKVQAFGFGPACAAIASEKIVKAGGTDPFIGALMLNEAITGEKRVASVTVEAKKPDESPKPAATSSFSLVMRMFRISKSKQGDFPSSDVAMNRAEELKGISKAFRAFRETPSQELFNSMVRTFDVTVAEGFDPMTMSAEDVKRIEQLAFGFGCEAENIGRFMEQADKLRTAKGALDLTRKTIGAKKPKRVLTENSTNNPAFIAPKGRPGAQGQQNGKGSQKKGGAKKK